MLVFMCQPREDVRCRLNGTACLLSLLPSAAPMPAVAPQMPVSAPRGRMSFQGRQLIKMNDKFLENGSETIDGHEPTIHFLPQGEN